MAMPGSVPNFSSTTPRRSSICGGSSISAGGGCGPDGMPAKWRSAKVNAFVGVDVAENQQDRIRRRVVRVEEFLHVGERGGVEVVKVAVKIVRIGPIAKRHGRQIEPGKAAVGLIEHVDANFFLDDVALVAQIFIVHFQGAHAVGFQPEQALERIRRGPTGSNW